VRGSLLEQFHQSVLAIGLIESSHFSGSQPAKALILPDEVVVEALAFLRGETSAFHPR